ncbi:MAG: TRAP transporter large permease [Acholeplasmataceae bacterium]|nr:TRAP transporter large permease [Acholeplasmataceae bacterium]
MNVFLLFIAMFVFIAMGIPIAWSVGLSSFFYIVTNNIPVAMLTQKMTASLQGFVFVALPLFLLTGDIMNTGGLTERLVNLSKACFGRFKGALAYINVFVSLLFGGVQGLATADTVAIGSMLIPAMEKEGYTKEFATAITCASSPLGAIIPPSVIMIIYGSVCEVSIGNMFLGGFIPGIIMGGVQMLYVLYLSKSKKHADHIPGGSKISREDRIKWVKEGLPTMVLPLLIIGGIVGGVVTATESAVIAVIYATLLSVITKELKWKDIPKILWNGTKTIGSVMIILATSSVFGYILTLEKIPQLIVNLLLDISNNKFVLLLIINLFLLVVGTFMDPTPAAIILGPILLPVLKSFGMDPVHIGVMMCMNLIMGQITPPVGSCLYLASGISKLSVEKISRALLPFYAINFGVTLLISYVPAFVMTLPKLFGV